MTEITFQKVEILGETVIHCFICYNPVRPKREKVSMVPTKHPGTGEDWLIFFHDSCGRSPEGEEILKKLKEKQSNIKNLHSQ